MENARLAIDIISTARFDCVILDIDLPDSNGFDVCTAIRVISSLPIIFLSAYSEEENRIRVLSIGGDDFVSKPYSLLDALRRRLLWRRAFVRCVHSQ